MVRIRLALGASLAAVAGAACRQEASLWSWLRSPCDELAAAIDVAPHLSGQVVVNLGPAVFSQADHEGLDALLLQELQAGSNSLPDDLDDFHQDMQGLIDALGGHFADAVRVGGFHLDSEAGHMRLRAKLPGYVMASGEEFSEGDALDGPPEQPPLSVRIVGSSLVVSGRKTDGRMTSSFQRSFALPDVADAERISVSYSMSDGLLMVDVPTKDVPGSSGQVWRLNWEDSGSHTSIVVASGRVAAVLTPKPALRGATAPSAQDMLHRLQRLLHLERGQEQAAVAARAIEPPVQVLPDRPAEPEPPALVVQRKDARPFWRLGASQSTGVVLEIVAPDGVTLGRLGGKVVPFFDSQSEVAGEVAPSPIGELELPVAVDARLCRWALDPPPQERVLECTVDAAAVRALQINISQEL